PVYAAGTGKKLQLGASALADNAGASGAATVYYGKNDQTWRVIGYETKGVASTSEKLALLAGSAMSSSKFNNDNAGNNYAGSLLKNAVDAIYSSTYFTKKEMEAIIKRDLNVQEYSYTAPYTTDITDGISGTALAGDNAPYLWPLSTKEAHTLSENGSGITYIGDYWWLRSPGFTVDYAAIVSGDGLVICDGFLVSGADRGVRPAFNLNLSSILFTSDAEDIKSSGDAGILSQPGNHSSDGWKLTVKDDNLSVSTNGTVTRNGNTVTVPFTASEGYDRISVFISDKAWNDSGAELKYYGQLKTSDVTGTFTLPDEYANKTCGTDYHVYILAEDVNDGTKTDYASEPVELSIPSLVYTVTFEENGHGEAPNTQTVTSGDKATKPSDPTADGYTFGGWYKEAGCQNKYDFNTAVTESITLYAKWTQNPPGTYTVTFDPNGHGTAPETQTVTSGATASKPSDPTADAYTFGGWYTEKECKNAYDFNTTVTANITLYAKWTQNPPGTYTVTFNANGHGKAPDAQTVTSGEKAEYPEKPTVEGYIFGGWYTEKECNTLYDFTSPVTGNITLYAKWEEDKDGTKNIKTDGSIPMEVSKEFLGILNQSIPDELKAIIKGKDIIFDFFSEALNENSVSSEVKNEMEKIKDYNTKKGYTIGQFFDLTLYIKDKNDTSTEYGTISETEGDVEIIVTIPKNLRRYGRTFYILRIHNGEIEVVGSGTEDEVPVKTDSFSTYALAYTDLETEETVREEYEEESSSPSYPVNPNLLVSYYEPAPYSSFCLKQEQGSLARLAFNTAMPAGYKEAFTLSLLVNGNADYSLKTGKLVLTIPEEYSRAGRSFA
ncbi:MAG: InlB B-repeat-containing protein, partial [Lachnospiraceae bacterium]|nr:InlB B-repeat-containing protein [Lachnospiraceae bacterium]